MKVCLIGSGNAATVLGRLISRAGHTIVQVLGRNTDHTAKLATELQAPFSVHFSETDKRAEIYIVAISDTALLHIGESLRLDKKLVVHTSGSVPMDVLQKVSKNFGVLYPLQSLNKQEPLIPEIPFLVDGHTADNRALITDFAYSISPNVRPANDQERERMHLAAVFVNNYGNHLFALVQDYCHKQQLPFEQLYPLIDETARRMHGGLAANRQTGPARRNDRAVIEKQEEQLKEFPAMQQLHRLFSESIRKFYQDRKE